MAKSKSKKTEKKSTPKTTAHKEAEVKETVVVSETVVEVAPKEAEAVASCPAKPLKGFFARKYDVNENVLTIFKSPRVWGALLGELVGTMLLSMMLLTLGVQPLYLIFGAVCIYIADGFYFVSGVFAGVLGGGRVGVQAGQTGRKL